MFDVNKIRQDFPMLQNNPDMVYFDNSATTFKPQCVIDTINDFYTKHTVNVHRGDYPLSYNVSVLYDDVRNKVAKFINAQKDEIFYTKGATDGLNQIAYELSDLAIKDNDVILTTYMEHASNILPWFKVAERKHAIIKYIPVDSEGQIILSEFIKVLTPEVKVIAINYVSNVLGHTNPIKEICQLAHKQKTYVVVDAAQAIPHMKVDVKDLDCDFLAFSAHKMCGADGAGAVYGKKEILYKLNPLYYGGDSNARFNKEQELTIKKGPERFESGTPAIEQVLAMGSAIDYLEKIGMENIEAYEKELGIYLQSELAKLDNVKVYNPNSRSGIVSFNIKGIFSQDVAGYLGSKGICVRSGNHCAKISKEVMGTDESIRASLYFYNTKEEIDKFIAIVKDTTLEKCIDVVVM